LQPTFACLGQQEGSFPVAEAAAKQVISLPMGPSLQPDVQQRIVDVLCQC
jgi:dTDP-4-amino-4,6-dideoxygalactose transaminase